MKSIFYRSETTEILSVVNGQMQPSRSMLKSGISVVHTERDIPRDAKTIHFLQTGFEIVPEQQKQTVMYSAIIPYEAEEVIVERDRTGLGDTISVLSALQQMKKEYPLIKLTFRAWRPYIQMLEKHPDIDILEDCKTVIRKPIEDSKKQIVIDLSHPCPGGTYETARQEETDKSRSELFTQACGLNWEGMRPILHLDDDEKKFGMEYVFKNTDRSKKNIGLVLRSAEPWKDWPYVEEFAESCLEEFNLFVYDHALVLDIDGVNNTAKDLVGIREVMSVLPYMDCVITPDTGIMHMCDALDIPALSLFGSMIGKLYKEKYDNSLSIIQGRCIYGKKPCFYKVCEGKGNYQPCMSSIKPDTVMRQAKNIMYTGGISPASRLVSNNDHEDGIMHLR